MNNSLHESAIKLDIAFHDKVPFSITVARKNPSNKKNYIPILNSLMNFTKKFLPPYGPDIKSNSVVLSILGKW